MIGHRSETITVDEIKDLARRGKLRFRAFGEEHFYGVGHPFHGDLARAANDLDRILTCGMVAVYSDANGIFLGPINPFFVANQFDASPLSHGGRLQ